MKALDLGNKRVFSTVLKLTVPAMLAQFVSVLYSIVDRMYVGNIEGTGDVALICGFAQLVNAGLVYGDIDYKDEIVILKIMDGRILGYVLPPEKLTVAVRAVGCVAILLAVCGTIVLYFFGNNRICDKRLAAAEKKGIDTACKDMGLVPLAAYVAKRLKEKRKVKDDSDG